MENHQLSIVGYKVMRIITVTKTPTLDLLTRFIDFEGSNTIICTESDSKAVKEICNYLELEKVERGTNIYKDKPPYLSIKIK